MRARSGLLIAGVFLWITITMLNSAYGRTYIVDSPTDSHDVSPGDSLCGDHPVPDSCLCSFRAAIEEANALPGPDTIIIADSIAQVLLTLGTVDVVDDSTAILGNGSFPAIDGGFNPMATDIIRLAASHTTVQGLTFRKARRHGLVIEDHDNLIGGNVDEERNVFVGNGLDYTEGYAIVLTGNNTADNHVGGNFVGLYGNGTVLYANDNGILVTASAHNNVIGTSDNSRGNLISGNNGYGIHITGEANDNQVCGNTIGPDIVGVEGPGNGAGGIRIDSAAHHNRIGGDSESERNQISANGADGIAITGRETHSNSVSGNYIGICPDGWTAVPNAGDGISISEGSTDNTIGGSTDGERNLISGNVGEGISIDGLGTDGNLVYRNGVGVSVRGTWLYGDNTRNANGVVISGGAQYNMIRSNVLSANVSAGLLIRDPASSHNVATGNYIGLISSGTSWAPNGSGVVIRNGASHNEIGGDTPEDGNVISGNVYDAFPLGAGVVIFGAGSSYNSVQGNKIGTNAAGTRGYRNGTAGVLIGNRASHNLIGGDTPAAGNLISGNGSSTYAPSLGRGIHIFGDGTDHNRVSNNAIGLTVDSTMAISNYGHGIGIFEGARYNVIGGEDNSHGNLVVGNEGHGICIGDTETKYNTVRLNQFYDNDSISIVLRSGTQNDILPPEIIEATPFDVSGSGAPSGSTVDLYLIVKDSAVYDRGVRSIGSGLALSNGSFSISLDEHPDVGDSITALVTDAMGNSSALAAGVIVTVPTAVNDPTSHLPLTFSLSQNYPNPFNPATIISFTLPQAADIELAVYNLLGQRVITLVSGMTPPGTHEILWDGRDASGTNVSSAVYFYRLTSEQYSAQHKMLLLK